MSVNYICTFYDKWPFFRILATTRAAFQSQELRRVKTRSLFMLSQVSEYSSRISVLLFWSYNLHDRPFTKWWFLGINPISRFITYGLFSNRAHTILNNLNKVVNRKPKEKDKGLCHNNRSPSNLFTFGQYFAIFRQHLWQNNALGKK